jgi:hypothetical protein
MNLKSVNTDLTKSVAQRDAANAQQNPSRQRYPQRALRKSRFELPLMYGLAAG